MKTKAY